MGIPIQTPMGATGGAGIFTAIDNTAELNALITAVVSITTALSTKIAQDEVHWGPSALLIPGSPAASLGIIGAQLLALNTNLKAVEAKSTALNGTLGAISNGIAAQTQSINAANVIAGCSLANQVTTNAVNLNETYAALTRNGIQIQPFPNIPELLKQNLAVSTQFAISTNFLASLTSISNSLIQILINYLKTLFPVIYAQSLLDKLWAATGINKVVAAIQDLDRTTAKQAQTLADVAARGGTYIPGVSGGVPPTPGS